MIPGISIIHEDNSVLVVDKPSGMLSQPGRTVNDSVLTRVLEARPDATGSVKAPSFCLVRLVPLGCSRQRRRR